MFAVAPSPAKRPMSSRVHDLHVSQVMTAARRAVPRAGGRHRVQGLPDRAVADRVEVDLEALAVQRGDESR